VLTPEDGRADAVIEYLWGLPRGESSFVTVVIPELFTRPSLVSAITRRPEFSLKVRLLSEPGVVITDVPVLAPALAQPARRAACRILVSGAHAASMRAVNYASTLGFEDTRALSFAFDSEEADRLRRGWLAQPMRLPLEVEEAPLPRPRRSAAATSAGHHRRPGGRSSGDHAGVDLQRTAAAAPQPASALHQTSALI
jgi:hypothetical protein